MTSSKTLRQKPRPFVYRLGGKFTSIESLNSGLRKVTKGKGSFINENALMKVLYLRIQDLQRNWSKGIANWNKIENELALLFEDRFLKHIEKQTY